MRGPLLVSAMLAIGLWLLGSRGAEGATLFGLIDTGELFASADQGTTWSVRAALPVRDALAIAAGAEASQLFLATRSGSLFRSSDAGTSWIAASAVDANDLVDLVVRSDLSIILLTGSGTVYRSTDGGASFAPLAALPAPNFVSLTKGDEGDPLHALTRTGETWTSEDGGVVWTAVGALPVSDAREILWLAPNLWVLTGTGDLFRSADGGSTWTAVGTLSQIGAASLVHDDALLIAAVETGEVAASTNGSDWTWRGAINQMTVTAVGIDTPASSSVAPQDALGAIAISAPWPNPVRQGRPIAIEFELRVPGDVSVDLYDPAGRRLRSLSKRMSTAGENLLSLDTRELGAGVYLVGVSSGSGARTGKRIVVLP